jgi:hypothetical protein
MKNKLTKAQKKGFKKVAEVKLGELGKIWQKYTKSKKPFKKMKIYEPIK